MDAYRYTALPAPEDGKHWIRLLKLMPSTDRTAPLRAHLQTIELHSDLRIIALSYFWGDPSPTEILRVEDTHGTGGVVRLRTNLYHALCAFRPEHEPLLLWVDAICIDQGSVVERSSQVALMGMIYSQANTRVWLGQDPEDYSRQVFQTLEDFSTVFWHRHDELPELARRAMTLDPRIWQGIRELYQNPWFERAWVQQEIGLAPDWAFYWGDHAVCDHHAILGFDSWLEDAGRYVAAHFKVDQRALVAVRRNWISYGRSVTFGWGGGCEEHLRFLSDSYFLMVLLESSVCKATDPRDHIYAFLGHPSARRRHAYEPGPIKDIPNFYRDLSINGPPTLVQPDYGKSIDEVYIEFARALLEQHQDLRPLGAVMHTEDSLSSGRPSWVPSWDLIGKQTAIGCRADQYLAPIWITDASALSFIERPGLGLEVHGVIVGKISEMLDDSVYDHEIPDSLRQGRRFFRSDNDALDVGLIQAVAREGDFVVLLHTATTPCVLRRTQNDDFQLIGTCFVQPLMRREGIEQLIWQSDAKVQRLVLR